MRRLAPHVFFAALAIALFPKAAAGVATLFHYDTGLQNLAFRAWWFAQLKAGHFATWCPGMFAGYPLFAETQTGPLYPPTFLLFTALPPALAFSWSVVLHFALAGAGAFLLARRLGVAMPAALLAGAVFELSGFLVTHVVHFNLLVGAAWAPWIAWLALEATDGRPRAAASLALVFAGLLLGAHPYTVMLGALLAAVVVAGRVGASWRRGAAAAAGLACVLGVAVLLAAVQVLPAREWIARTPRGDAVDWSFLTFGSFEPRQIATFLTPNAFGTPVNGTFWGGPDWSHFAETCVYAGAVTIALAVAALVLRRDAATATFAALGALSFLLMLGKYTPLYRVVAWIPVAQSTRLPARFGLLLTLALAVLAALGLEALRRETNVRRRRLAAGAGFVALLVLGAAAWTALEPARSPDGALATTGHLWSARMAAITAVADAESARGLILVAASILALAPFLGRRVPAWAAVPPLLLVVFDLFSFAHDFNPTIPTRSLMEPPPAARALPAVHPRPRIFRQGLDEIWERDPGIPRTDLVTPAWKGNEETYSSATWAIPPNSQLLWGVDSGEGFTSLPPSGWLEWMGLPAQPGAAPRPDLTDGQADLLSLDAVLSSGSGIAGVGWDVRALPGDLYLSQNRNPLPRVRLARSWTTMSRADVLAAIRDPDRDPRRALLLETSPEGRPSSQQNGPVDEPLEAREMQPGRWRIEVPAAATGIVVLSESYDPDWIATHDDGTRLPVLRADGLFVAFAAPPGGGSVELRHAPKSVRFGAILSAATLLALGAGLVVIRGRRFAALADEGRPASRGTTAVIVLVAFVIALASATAGVGRGPGESTDPLLAAAVESWSREAFGAMSAGQPAEAARLLAIAADRAPHASTFYRLGLAERAAGRIDQARGAFRRAIAIDDKFEPARSALAGLESGQDSTSSIE